MSKRKDLERKLEEAERRTEEIRKENARIWDRYQRSERDVAGANAKLDNVRRDLLQETQRLYGIMALIPNDVLSEAIGKYMLSEVRETRPEFQEGATKMTFTTSGTPVFKSDWTRVK